MSKGNLLKKDKEAFRALKPLVAVYECATGLYKSDVIDDQTMHDFDAMCLPSLPDIDVSNEQT